MTRVPFEPRELMQQLEASGFSREKAEALTWDTSRLVVNSLGDLETRECLTKRIDEIEASLTAEMDGSFNHVDKRFSRLEVRSTRMIMLLGAILILAIPALQHTLDWLGP